MTETDAMRLLADANPVHSEDQDAISLPDAVFGRHRPQRRLVLAVAVVAGAIAASLIAVFAVGGSPKQPLGVMRSIEPAISLARPLPHPDAKEITLADAAKVLGAPIVFPDDSLASPADVGAVWAQRTGPVVDVAVTFPRTGLIVNYERPIPYPQPVPQMYATEARQSPDSMSVIDLNGVPALATRQNSDQLHQNFGAISFVENGTVVSVLGHYETATLESIAQSIVEQAPPQPPIAAGPTTAPTNVDSAAAAQKLLPFAAVLPSEEAPTSLAVFESSHQLMAFFNTSATGPYELVEGPSDETVAMLEETAKRWTVGPIHEIDLVDGVEVLLQGSSDGSLTASWLRSGSGTTILTWIQGPETAARGQVDGTFTKEQALSIAGDVIAQGG